MFPSLYTGIIQYFFQHTVTIWSPSGETIDFPYLLACVHWHKVHPHSGFYCGFAHSSMFAIIQSWMCRSIYVSRCTLLGSKGWNLKFSLCGSDKSASVGYPFYRPMSNCTFSDYRSLNLRGPLRLFNERSMNTSDFLVLKLPYHTACFGHIPTICINSLSLVVYC